MKGKKPSLKKALLTIVSALLIVVSVSYLANAFNGVFARSNTTVANTSWLSFEDGKIEFEETAGARITPEDGLRSFVYEEKEGIVKVTFKDTATVEWYTRFKDNELTTQDGLIIFYIQNEG